jgi:hypothetical protein
MVFDGTDGSPLPALPNGFLAYGTGFTRGVFIAAGDVLNNDGVVEIIVAPKTGPGKVKVFDGTGTQLLAFFPFVQGFTGGVRVAAGDVAGGPGDEIIALRGSPPGVPALTSVVRFFDSTGARVGGFKVSNSTNNFVAAGNVDDTGFDEVIVGLKGKVQVFDSTGAVQGSPLVPYAGYPGKIRVAAADVDGDGDDDIVTGTGGNHDSEVRVIDGMTLSQLDSFFAFAPDFDQGIFVAGG